MSGMGNLVATGIFSNGAPLTASPMAKKPIFRKAD